MEHLMRSAIDHLICRYPKRSGMSGNKKDTRRLLPIHQIFEIIRVRSPPMKDDRIAEPLVSAPSPLPVGNTGLIRVSGFNGNIDEIPLPIDPT
jgi:hypothetical protein